MDAVNYGKSKLAVICSVVCSSGLLLLVLGLRGANRHDGPSPVGLAREATDIASPPMPGPEGTTNTNSPAADRLSFANMEQLAPDTPTLTEMLNDLPIPRIRAGTRHLTNLTSAEEAKAIALWEDERNSWSGLHGFSGNIVCQDGGTSGSCYWSCGGPMCDAGCTTQYYSIEDKC